MNMANSSPVKYLSSCKAECECNVCEKIFGTKSKTQSDEEVSVILDLKKCHHCQLTFDVSEQYTFDIHQRECQLLSHNFKSHDLDNFTCLICDKLIPKYFKPGELSVEIFMHVRKHGSHLIRHLIEHFDVDPNEINHTNFVVPDGKPQKRMRLSTEKPVPLMDLNPTPPEMPKETLQTCQHCMGRFPDIDEKGFQNHVTWCKLPTGNEVSH